MHAFPARVVGLLWFTCCAALAEPSPIIVNVRDFGAVGDGKTDDAKAINKALDHVRKNGEYGAGREGMVIFIPPGIYRLDVPLDLNGRQFNIAGAGPYQTVLRGNTGDGAAVVEMIGTGFCKLSGLLIDDLVDSLPPDQQHPSSIGILMARVDAPQKVTDYAGPRFAAQSWYNNLEDVAIRMGTRTQANGGRGTCAYYNCCSEISAWHNCYFQGDVGAVITSSNLYGLAMKTERQVEWRAGVPEKMRMWAGDSSMTVVRASGANSLIGITGPALLIGGASDVSIDSYLGHLAHMYLPNDPKKWPAYAIEVRGVSHNLAHRGSIEGYAGAMNIVGVAVAALDLRCYLDIQNMFDREGHEVDAPPVVMLSSQQVEQPPHSGIFTRVGASLANSTLHVAATPNTSGVRSRLIDTTSDASHSIQGNHLSLGNMRVRMRNTWSSTNFTGNLATSTLPLGKSQFDLPPSITRAGNLLTASDGVESDSFMTIGAVPALPPASASLRGRMVRLESEQGDQLFICEKTTAGAFAWRKL